LLPTTRPFPSPHLRAVLQALLVTFLWSTSWVLIKVGLKASLPPVTFAGLRYSLAFACLLPWAALDPACRRSLGGLSRKGWAQLGLLGVVFYTLTQGAQFVSLAYLPAATLNLLLNFSPACVALFSGLAIHEPPRRAQWAGVLLTLAGAAVYFLPLHIPHSQALGLMAGLVGMLANSGAALLGRHINRNSGLPALAITTASMGVGGLLLLAGGIAMQGFGQPGRIPSIGPQAWLIIAWLAVVNTAAAFTLWNHTLRRLTAVESSLLNSSMLPQIAILAWLFLGEALNARQIAGLALVGAGVILVQLFQNRE
jgi:drug/metabolite transporter (DMT)-like permease